MVGNSDSKETIHWTRFVEWGLLAMPFVFVVFCVALSLYLILN